MRKLVSLLAIFGVAAFVPSTLEAATINLNPGSPGIIQGFLGAANCEPDCVEDAFGLPDGTLTNPDDLLYKSNYVSGNANGNDEGSFAGSYNTTFSPAGADPTDATISYILGQPAISCPSCYLAIKDGNAQPSYYFYDLAAWDGISDIVMTGFWPGDDKGAISHVSIWGFPADDDDDGGSDDDGSTIPEPASVLLIGLGMAAAAARLRQRKA